jgi:hypothetical protein
VESWLDSESGQDFFPSPRVKNQIWVTPSFLFNVHSGTSLGLKRPGCVDDHPRTSSTGVQSEWSCTSNPASTPWRAEGQPFLYIVLKIHVMNAKDTEKTAWWNKQQHCLQIKLYEKVQTVVSTEKVQTAVSTEAQVSTFQFLPTFFCSYVLLIRTVTVNKHIQNYRPWDLCISHRAIWHVKDEG